MGWPNNLWKLYWGIIILSFWDMFIGVYALNVILLWKFQRVNTEQRSSDSRCSVRPIDNDSFQEGTQPISRTKRIGLVVQGRTVDVFTYHLSIIAVWPWHTFFFIYFFPFSFYRSLCLKSYIILPLPIVDLFWHVYISLSNYFLCVWNYS